ncbi:MAG: peptidylprolyl isomerase [Planctomycetota bacterium]
MTRWTILLAVAGAVPALLAQAPPPATTQPASEAPQTQPAETHVYVKMDTTLGEILLDLDAERAPITVKNFLDYADAGFYDGTIFHRVMSNFMIQGGGYTPDLVEKNEGLRQGIKNEWKNGLKNVRGSIAMARLGGQADSATAQFFINVVDNAPLDQPRDGAGYAVFGKVISGLDTVDRIRYTKVKDDPRLPMGPVVPVEPVIIKSVKRVPAAEAKAVAHQAEEQANKAAAEAKAEADKQVRAAVARLEQETGKKFETTPSGLMILHVTEGGGATPTLADIVEAHYTLMLLNGQKLQSSHDSGKPLSFPLDKLIAGWKQGLALMKVGGKAMLIVPPDLAYGATPPPGSGIPSNATLLFEVELLGVKPQTPQ